MLFFKNRGFLNLMNFVFPNEWSSSMAFTVSFRYTLPEIVGDEDQDCILNLRESVVLKYQILDHFLNVFGSLTSGNDEHKFGREVYEFWKIVKDGLALPLLIDLRAKAAVPSPLCFTRLPLELR